MDLLGTLTRRRELTGACGAPASVFSNLEGALLKSELLLPQGIYSYSWYFMSKIGLTSDLIHIRKTEKMALSYCFNCNLNLATFILPDIPSLQFITLRSVLFLKPNIDLPLFLWPFCCLCKFPPTTLHKSVFPYPWCSFKALYFPLVSCV